MVGRLMGRSGRSVAQVAEVLEWRPDVIYQIGVGLNHQEVEIFQDEWPGVEFVSCEPDPRILKSLREEDYPGELYDVAISRYIGTGTLYTKKRHSDGSSLFQHKETPKDNKFSEAVVDVTTLDVLFGTPKRDKALLWLDCEGSELAALQGGEKFMERVDMVNVELTSRPPGHGWPTPEEIHDWLAAHGYYQIWLHTYRIWSMQADAVYVRANLFNPELCGNVNELKRFREENQ